mmetsp:Transcript_2308/g.9046  ORF Transcript_2308/g.9046 Transcript_2308/m.9046 type:complete len:95 (+) Transcript_2308:1574-1858(+)
MSPSTLGEQANERQQNAKVNSGGAQQRCCPHGGGSQQWARDISGLSWKVQQSSDAFSSSSSPPVGPNDAIRACQLQALQALLRASKHKASTTPP